MTKQPNMNRGMTLIEVLITLCLMTLIVSVVFSVNGTLSRQYQKDVRRAQIFLEAQLIVAQMRTSFNRYGVTDVPKSQYYKISGYTSKNLSGSAMKRVQVSFIIEGFTYEILLEKPLVSAQ